MALKVYPTEALLDKGMSEPQPPDSRLRQVFCRLRTQIRAAAARGEDPTLSQRTTLMVIRARIARDRLRERGDWADLCIKKHFPLDTGGVFWI